MIIETVFHVRATRYREERGLFFALGFMRHGASPEVGHAVTGPSGFGAPIAVVESVCLNGKRDPEIGLGFRYANSAELARWLGMNLVGAELVVRRPAPPPVVVVAYDPEWPRVFEGLERAWIAVLGDLAVAIHHVGSTAVPGLAAKPIIDVDVEIRTRADLPEVTRRLALLGYQHRGDLGVPGRESFQRDGASDLPRDGSGRGWPPHNLYVCATGCEELRRHLLFRDWVRNHPERVGAYASLKQRLAEMYRDDRESYIEGKAELVEEILAEAAVQRS